MTYCRGCSGDWVSRVGSVADTTIYELLPALSEEEFRPVLWNQLRQDLDGKAITNDLFPGGVATFDGKGAGKGMGAAPNAQCRETVCDKDGTPCWDAFALRACLTSSAARPVLDQEYILRKKNEASTFPLLLNRLVKQFPKLFRYVTFDAGITSALNSEVIRAAGKHYMCAIKRNSRTLFAQAQTLLEHASIVAVTEERAHGKQVRRELRRVSAPPDSKMAELTELWSVRHISTDHAGKSLSEDRAFAVSIPVGELTDVQKLALVRLHWGIENGANWTADMVLNEDTQMPCRAGNAVLVMGWLHLLAYNLLSVFRAHLPQQDRRPSSWKRATELLYQALTMLDLLREDPEPTPTSA